MNIRNATKWVVLGTLLALFGIMFQPLLGTSVALAQDAPAVDTPTTEPTRPPATNTPVPGATNTPIPAATNTPVPGATNTPANTPTSSGPVGIPEPITVILFGTGLAALSAAAAARRKKGE